MRACLGVFCFNLSVTNVVDHPERSRYSRVKVESRVESGDDSWGEEDDASCDHPPQSSDADRAWCAVSVARQEPPAHLGGRCSWWWRSSRAHRSGGRRNARRACFRKLFHPDYELAREQMQAIWDAWRCLRREPERSRRVIPLITANWLAYLELPAKSRPSPEPAARSLDLSALGPQSRSNARRLSPEALGRWLDSTYDAQKVLQFLDPTPVRTAECANHEDLVIVYSRSCTVATTVPIRWTLRH